MAFAAPKHMEGPKLQTKMSTWTPLNHQLMNDKVFEERCALLGKWFDKWSDAQRRRILTDLLERCSLSQLKFCNSHLQEKVPREALDFTSILPRVLSLYIFSFLDPRSLCRCAQVSWHWKSLTELDQLWMPKCLRFGWYINFSPTPFEQRIWKRQYIEMVKELHITRPKTPPKDEFVVIDVQPIAKEAADTKFSPTYTYYPKSSKSQGKKDLPPWRSSDKHPTDTVRFNYLDNYDPIEQGRLVFPFLPSFATGQNPHRGRAGRPISWQSTPRLRPQPRSWHRAQSGTRGYALAQCAHQCPRWRNVERKLFHKPPRCRSLRASPGRYRRPITGRMRSRRVWQSSLANESRVCCTYSRKLSGLISPKIHFPLFRLLPPFVVPSALYQFPLWISSPPPTYMVCPSLNDHMTSLCLSAKEDTIRRTQ
eukprot:XP_017945046.1 PREDICTED: F-box only protein 16 isoform X2 [Xenopus tropicalis]